MMGSSLAFMDSSVCKWHTREIDDWLIIHKIILLPSLWVTADSPWTRKANAGYSARSGARHASTRRWLPKLMEYNNNAEIICWSSDIVRGHEKCPFLWPWGNISWTLNLIDYILKCVFKYSSVFRYIIPPPSFCGILTLKLKVCTQNNFTRSYKELFSGCKIMNSLSSFTIFMTSFF